MPTTAHTYTVCTECSHMVQTNLKPEQCLHCGTHESQITRCVNIDAADRVADAVAFRLTNRADDC